MKVRNNIGGMMAAMGNSLSYEAASYKLGRVIHTVVDEYSLGFDDDYSNIGKVYFSESNGDFNKDDILNLPYAYPVFPNFQCIPLLEELIMIYSLPKSNSSDIQNSRQNYYLTAISLFNNNHHNAQSIYNNDGNDNIVLGYNIDEKSNISSMLPFEGDIIHSGRWGQSIRMGSTLKSNNSFNPWSSYGEVGKPITIISNNHAYPNDNKPYVENINNDGTSIYLTSNQSIDLHISRKSNNPLYSVLDPKFYTNNQLILNSDRLTLNSKKDDILLSSNTNINVLSNNYIYLESEQNIMLNSKFIFLGMDNNNIPTEPVLLGNKTLTLISDLLSSINTFSADLSNALSSPEGTKLDTIVIPSIKLNNKIQNIRKQLKDIVSKKVYTS